MHMCSKVQLINIKLINHFFIHNDRSPIFHVFCCDFCKGCCVITADSIWIPRVIVFFGFLVDFYGNQAPIVKARQFLNHLIFLEHFFSLQQQVLAGRASLSEQSAWNCSPSSFWFCFLPSFVFWCFRMEIRLQLLKQDNFLMALYFWGICSLQLQVLAGKATDFFFLGRPQCYTCQIRTQVQHVAYRLYSGAIWVTCLKFLPLFFCNVFFLYCSRSYHTVFAVAFFGLLVAV